MKKRISPISLENMFYNVLGKVGKFGRCVKAKKIEGTIVGVPNEPLDDVGLRNLFHKAITKDESGKHTVLKLHEAQGTVKSAFAPPSHSQKKQLINSLFVIVKDSDGKKHWCFNISVFDEEPESA